MSQTQAQAFIEQRIKAAEAARRANLLGDARSPAMRRHKGLGAAACASLEAAARGTGSIDNRGRPTKAALLRRAGASAGNASIPGGARLPYLPAVEFTGVMEASLDPRPQAPPPLQRATTAAHSPSRRRRPDRATGLPRMHATASPSHSSSSSSVPRMQQPLCCNVCSSSNMCTVDCCRYCGTICSAVPRGKSKAVLRTIVDRYARNAAALGLSAEDGYTAVSAAARGARSEELLHELLGQLESMLLGSAMNEGDDDRDNALAWSAQLGLIGTQQAVSAPNAVARMPPPAFMQAAASRGPMGLGGSNSGPGEPGEFDVIGNGGYDRPRFFYWDGRDANEGVGLAGADPGGLRTLLVALLLAPLQELQRERALAELRLNARTKLLVRSAASRLGEMEGRQHWSTVQDALGRISKNDVGALLLDLVGALVAAGRAETTPLPIAAATAPDVAPLAPVLDPFAAQPVPPSSAPLVAAAAASVAEKYGVDAECGSRSSSSDPFDEGLQEDELQRLAIADGAGRLVKHSSSSSSSSSAGAGPAQSALAKRGLKAITAGRAVLALLDRAILNSVGVSLEVGNDAESRVAAAARAGAREAAADVAATLAAPNTGAGGVMGHCASLAYILRRLQAADDPENVLEVPELTMPPPGLMGGCLVAAEDPAEACARVLLHGVTDETRDALMHAWFHGQELQSWIAANAPELISPSTRGQRHQVVLIRAEKSAAEKAEEDARAIELLEKQAAAAGKVLRNRRSLAVRLTAFAAAGDGGSDGDAPLPPHIPRRMSVAKRESIPNPQAIALARAGISGMPQQGRSSLVRMKVDGATQTEGRLDDGENDENEASAKLQSSTGEEFMLKLERNRRQTMAATKTSGKKARKRKSDQVLEKRADLEWTLKQVFALFEKRAEAEAARKASSRGGQKAMTGMADFVYDDFIRQFGIPALARRKMLELLKALEVHASTNNPIVQCFSEALSAEKDSKEDGERAGDDGSGGSVRDSDLLANFVTEAIMVVRDDVATNLVFPAEQGETRINWISESRCRKLLPVLFCGTPTWNLAEGTGGKAALHAAIKSQRTRGAGKWRLERHAGYQLAKTWRLNVIDFVQLVVMDFRRQLEAQPVGARRCSLLDSERGRGAAGAAGKKALEEDDDDDDDDDDAADEDGSGVNEDELLISNTIFSSANDECRSLILQRCTTVHYGPGEVIMAQGDPANEMFIIKRGEVAVKISFPSKVEGGTATAKVVGTLSAPDFFGESALMEEDGRRTATIFVPRAKKIVDFQEQADGAQARKPPAKAPHFTGVDLLKLTRTDFNAIMASHPSFHEELHARNAGYVEIERVPMFQGRGRAFTNDMLSRVEVGLVVEPGKLVVRQGDLGDCMYFIISGSLDVFIENRKVRTINANGYFGEKALLEFFGTNLRTASVRANERCELWSLHKDAFDELCVMYPQFAGDVRAKAGVGSMGSSSADFPDNVEQKHLNLAADIARKWRARAIRKAQENGAEMSGALPELPMTTDADADASRAAFKLSPLARHTLVANAGARSNS